MIGLPDGCIEKGWFNMNNRQGSSQLNEQAKEQVHQLQEIIDNTDNIVFFGGAGVSTESGIPDFRSVDGLYNQKYDYPPEEILSHSFFMRNTGEFYRFYREKMIIEGAKPNKAHIALAQLEKAGKLKAVVTQNIDGLHTAAGSKVVYELHGSTLRNYCMKCGKFFDLDKIKQDEGNVVPKCECGGTIKPDVVLYEEGLDDSTVRGAVSSIMHADVLIIGGTSLNVYPAAGMIQYFEGSRLVLLNMSSTPADDRADLVIHAPIGEVLGQIRI